MRLAALLRDPLAHFLAAGLALFAVTSALKPPQSGETEIVVDRAALLAHIQYRSKAFEPGAAEALLDALSADAREKLIADYVREEALDREAIALGLDAGDYVIRQRRVQKAEFLAEAAAQTGDPSAEDVAAYYAGNSVRYASLPAATFTHVFVSSKERSQEEARIAALVLRDRLRKENAGFEDATGYGDRFLFHKNYVDRTDDYVRSQLGPVVTAAVFGPEAALGEWIGPYASDHGEHLIFVTARSPARLAPLAEIEELVRADLTEERRQQAIDASIDAIVKRYRVVEKLESAE
jgi:parvulin-like peptidyl-prolyl isomerase